MYNDLMCLTMLEKTLFTYTDNIEPDQQARSMVSKLQNTDLTVLRGLLAHSRFYTVFNKDNNIL